MQGTGEASTVVVREVGPRDGLQMAKAIMPTAAKLRLDRRHGRRRRARDGGGELRPARRHAADGRRRRGDPRRPRCPSRTSRRGARAQPARRAERGRGGRAVHHHARLGQRGSQPVERAPLPRRPGRRGRARGRPGRGRSARRAPHRGRHLNRVRLLAAGRGAGAGRCRACRAAGRGRGRHRGLADTLGYADPVQVRRLVRVVRAEVGPSGSAICTCTTRSGRRWPTRWWPGGRRARLRCSAGRARRLPVRARHRSATSPPKTSSTCSNRRASTPASTLRSSSAAARAVARGAARRAVAWPGRGGRRAANLPPGCRAA